MPSRLLCCRWFQEDLSMCTREMTGFSVLLSEQGKVVNKIGLILDWIAIVGTVLMFFFSVINSLMQSAHPRISWHPGHWCAWCRECKYADEWWPFLRLWSTLLTFYCLHNLLYNLQVDVTELVDGHSSYLSAAQQILEHLELNTYYPVFVPLPAVSK